MPTRITRTAIAPERCLAMAKAMDLEFFYYDTDTATLCVSPKASGAKDALEIVLAADPNMDAEVALFTDGATVNHTNAALLALGAVKNLDTRLANLNGIVANLSGNADNYATTIDLETGLADKVTATALNDRLAGKADVSALNTLTTAVGSKVDTAALNAAVSDKVTTTALNDRLADKAGATDMARAVADIAMLAPIAARLVNVARKALSVVIDRAAPRWIRVARIDCLTSLDFTVLAIQSSNHVAAKFEVLHTFFSFSGSTSIKVSLAQYNTGIANIRVYHGGCYAPLYIDVLFRPLLNESVPNDVFTCYVSENILGNGASTAMAVAGGTTPVNFRIGAGHEEAYSCFETGLHEQMTEVVIRGREVISLTDENGTYIKNPLKACKSLQMVTGPTAEERLGVYHEVETKVENVSNKWMRICSVPSMTRMKIGMRVSASSFHSECVMNIENSFTSFTASMDNAQMGDVIKDIRVVVDTFRGASETARDANGNLMNDPAGRNCYGCRHIEILFGDSGAYSPEIEVVLKEVHTQYPSYNYWAGIKPGAEVVLDDTTNSGATVLYVSKTLGATALSYPTHVEFTNVNLTMKVLRINSMDLDWTRGTPLAAGMRAGISLASLEAITELDSTDIIETETDTKLPILQPLEEKQAAVIELQTEWNAPVLTGYTAAPEIIWPKEPEALPPPSKYAEVNVDLF